MITSLSISVAQPYIRVMNRPMALSGKRRVIWTKSYYDNTYGDDVSNRKSQAAGETW